MLATTYDVMMATAAWLETAFPTAIMMQQSSAAPNAITITITDHSEYSRQDFLLPQQLLFLLPPAQPTGLPPSSHQRYGCHCYELAILVDTAILDDIVIAIATTTTELSHFSYDCCLYHTASSSRTAVTHSFLASHAVYCSCSSV